MNDLQRDIGRMEATLGNAVETIQEIRFSQAEMKAEISEIKSTLSSQAAVRQWNWKILGSVSLFAGVIGHLLSYVKFLFTLAP